LKKSASFGSRFSVAWGSVNKDRQIWDVIVLGAGAAGLMCAIEAGKRGRRALVLDHAERIGKKILISGGGRCNFTNIHCKAENFLSANPHFAKSALARFRPADMVALVEKHGIRYHEKTLGQLFCDRSAHDIVNLLERECAEAGVRILTHTRMDAIEHSDSFVVRSGELEFVAPALVVATGGLSIPKMGATDFGYRLAAQFGIAVRPCRPGLVPLVLSRAEQELWCDLAGVSAEVVASMGKRRFREKMLITHRGLSGPAILQISSYWEQGSSIALDLAPGQDVTEPLRRQISGREETMYRMALRQALSQRLSDRWLEVFSPEDWSNRALAKLEENLHRWEVFPAGTEGHEKAEVTVGGVDTNELSARTMESRKVKGLFFVGEVVDVTGHLGGFNFQWAWASGFSAGQAV
jgi:predicted Rossmann fold flavoprotein